MFAVESAENYTLDMTNYFPQLTPEQCQAIAASGGLPIQFEDPQTHKLYVVVTPPETLALDDAYVNAELAKGLAALDDGDRHAWNPQGIKNQGRQKLALGESDN